MGAGVKFTVPTVADGHVYVGTSGAIYVFGLLTNPTTAPTAPTGLTATASSLQGLQVQLSWTDTSNNENAFKIERSTNGGAFVQIDVASVNATTYTDTAVVSGTTYTYRLRSTNPVGDSTYTNTASATPVTTPPVSLFSFEDGSGTIAADTAGSNTGVLVGATTASMGRRPRWHRRAFIQRQRRVQPNRAIGRTGFQQSRRHVRVDQHVHNVGQNNPSRQQHALTGACDHRRRPGRHHQRHQLGHAQRRWPDRHFCWRHCRRLQH